MKTENKSPFIDDGRRLLDFAAEEINRAEEDVVNYLVCHNTRNAISNFLKSFLTQNNEAFGDEPVNILLEKCRKIDDRFSNVDLSGILCSKVTVSDNDCYCLDTRKLRDCVVAARQIERLVATDAPAY